MTHFFLKKKILIVECGMWTVNGIMPMPEIFTPGKVQVILILMDASEENGHMISDRILECYRENYKGSFEFEYDIVKMEGSTNTLS